VNPNPAAPVGLYLGALIVYALGLIGFGLWISRRAGGSEGFFVAGRRLGPGLIFSSLLAANIGSGSIIGASGLGYRDGISAWWWVGSAGIGSLILAMWIGPRIWRVATQNGLYTAGDYLELRYGSAVRVTIAVLLWIVTLSVLSAQLIAMSQIFEFVLGTPRWVGALLGGFVVTVYFTAGGLWSSTWVNMVQLVVLLAGMLIAVPLALSAAGGWEAVQAAAPSQTDWSSFWTGPESGWILIALLVPAFVISPGLLQKSYGARDETALRIGIGIQGLVLMAFAFVPALIGMIAHVYAPDLGANSEFAVPIVLTQGLPPIVGALGLAAVFSAEVSSADAVLFMLSTSLSKDLYKRFVSPDATDEQVLRVARGAAIAGGVLGVSLALIQPTVLGALTMFYAVLSVSLFVPIVAGLFSRRGGVPEALASIGAGVAVLFTMRLDALSSSSRLLDPTLLGILASGAAFVLVATVRRRGPSSASEG
jgi:SSS family solute:Na+ symporter